MDLAVFLMEAVITWHKEFYCRFWTGKLT